MSTTIHEPVTAAQSGFIDDLIERKDLTDEHLIWIEQHRAGLTKAQAHKWIQALLRRPDREGFVPLLRNTTAWKVDYKVAAEDNKTSKRRIGFLHSGEIMIPRGSYAVETPHATNLTTFYKLWIGERYGWRLYLCHGPDETQMGKQSAATVLRQIADQGPATCASRFGLLIGKCGVCNRRLTNDKSRALGYGPVCAVNWGWPY